MRIPIFSGSYSGTSKRANPSECINFGLESDPSTGKKILVGLPGLKRQVAIPSFNPNFGEDYTNLISFIQTYGLVKSSNIPETDTYYSVFGNKTKLEDQALALISACANDDSANAEILVSALLDMQYTSSETGAFADMYNTATPIVAANDCIRLSSNMWAGIALGYYATTYPEGTNFAAAKTGLVSLLDYWCNSCLVVTDGDPQEGLFRNGKGVYTITEGSITSFDASSLILHTPTAGNCLAWIVLNYADNLNLTSLLTPTAADYHAIKLALGAKIIASSDEDGLYHAKKQRPLFSVDVVSSLLFDASGKKIILKGDVSNIILANTVFEVTGNHDSSNNKSYTVIGSNYVLASDYTVVDVLESPGHDVAYNASGDGYAIVKNKSQDVRTMALWTISAHEIGDIVNARIVIDKAAELTMEDDDYETVSGCAFSESFIEDEYLDEEESFEEDSTGNIVNNRVLPWSDYGFPIQNASVDCSSTFLVILALILNGNSATAQKLFDGLYPAREISTGGWPHANTELQNVDLVNINYSGLTPLWKNYILNTYSGFQETALAVLTQNPASLFNIAESGLKIAGRSINNGIRAMKAVGDYLYVVCGNVCVRIDQEWNVEVISTSSLSTDSGPVYMECSSRCVMICEGLETVGYVYDMVDLTWTKLNEVTNGFLAGGDLTYQDQYFISRIPGTWNYQFSQDAINWDSLDTGAAEYKPDAIVRVKSEFGQLWVFCTTSTEIHYNSGDADTPFRRIGGGEINVGCLASNSVAAIDNSFFWLASDKTIRKSSGINTIVISAPQMVYHLEQYKSLSDAFGFAFSYGGNAYYQISFPTDKVTWLYDIANSNWVKRSSYQSTILSDGCHRARCCELFNNILLMGDYEKGLIYDYDAKTYTDDENPIYKLVISPPITDTENRSIFPIDCLEVNLEGGVGLHEGQGGDPQIMLQHSNDWGNTWSAELWRSIGKQGNHGCRVRWHGLGSGVNKVFKIQSSDPVKTVILDAIINPRQ